ncbi:hypothetical protein [Amycolatopsis minnesotensis]|uniref:hypothetical protein n=1 Tax=Amycolatopsis minnesotensis TaxID=337894 RepID=UPI0031E23F8D
MNGTGTPVAQPGENQQSHVLRFNRWIGKRSPASDLGPRQGLTLWPWTFYQHILDGAGASDHDIEVAWLWHQRIAHRIGRQDEQVALALESVMPLLAQAHRPAPPPPELARIESEAEFMAQLRALKDASTRLTIRYISERTLQLDSEHGIARATLQNILTRSTVPDDEDKMLVLLRVLTAEGPAARSGIAMSIQLTQQYMEKWHSLIARRSRDRLDEARREHAAPERVEHEAAFDGESRYQDALAGLPRYQRELLELVGANVGLDTIARWWSTSRDQLQRVLWSVRRQIWDALGTEWPSAPEAAGTVTMLDHHR